MVMKTQQTNAKSAIVLAVLPLGPIKQKGQLVLADNVVGEFAV